MIPLTLIYMPTSDHCKLVLKLKNIIEPHIDNCILYLLKKYSTTKLTKPLIIDAHERYSLPYNQSNMLDRIINSCDSYTELITCIRTGILDTVLDTLQLIIERSATDSVAITEIIKIMIMYHSSKHDTNTINQIIKVFDERAMAIEVKRN